MWKEISLLVVLIAVLYTVEGQGDKKAPAEFPVKTPGSGPIQYKNDYKIAYNPDKYAKYVCPKKFKPSELDYKNKQHWTLMRWGAKDKPQCALRDAKPICSDKNGKPKNWVTFKGGHGEFHISKYDHFSNMYSSSSFYPKKRRYSSSSYGYGKKGYRPRNYKKNRYSSSSYGYNKKHAPFHKKGYNNNRYKSSSSYNKKGYPYRKKGYSSSSYKKKGYPYKKNRYSSSSYKKKGYPYKKNRYSSSSYKKKGYPYKKNRYSSSSYKNKGYPYKKNRYSSSSGYKKRYLPYGKHSSSSYPYKKKGFPYHSPSSFPKKGYPHHKGYSSHPYKKVLRSSSSYKKGYPYHKRASSHPYNKKGYPFKKRHSSSSSYWKGNPKYYSSSSSSSSSGYKKGYPHYGGHGKKGGRRYGKYHGSSSSSYPKYYGGHSSSSGSYGKYPSSSSSSNTAVPQDFALNAMYFKVRGAEQLKIKFYGEITKSITLQKGKEFDPRKKTWICIQFDTFPVFREIYFSFKFNKHFKAKFWDLYLFSCEEILKDKIHMD